MDARVVVSIFLVSIFLVGCSSSGGHQIRVDLKSDLAPQLEFTAIRTELGRVGEDPRAFTPERFVERRVGNDVAQEQELREGARIADLDGLGAGTWAVRVSALDEAGRIVVARTTLVEVTGDVGMTALLTRDCRGVECPAPGGRPELSACLAGQCVDPRCRPQAPEFCPERECASDAECESGSMCASARCGDEGVCFLSPQSESCAEGEQCHPALGCLPVIESDGGMPMDGSVCGTICFAEDRPCFAGYNACAPDGGVSCVELVQLAEGTSCGDGMTCDAAGVCVAM